MFSGEPGLVNVRREGDLQSEVLGTRATCSVFLGEEQGDWVKLEGEPGYVKLQLAFAGPLLATTAAGRGRPAYAW